MILLNTINGRTYVPVAFIEVTTLPMLREATSFLPLMLTNLLFLCCTVIIPVSSALNILWTG
jgi:hypothetical protein